MVVAIVLMLTSMSTIFAASSTVTIPQLNYFVQYSLSNNDTVEFKYTNLSATTQTAVFRITNAGYNDNSTSQVAGKLKGEYYLVSANGTSIKLGDISGSKLSGGIFNYLNQNASLVVKLQNAQGISQTGFKIKFDSQ
jgi:hypothetical protein